MTEEQRRNALALCDRILETAAKVQADMRDAKKVLDEMETYCHRPVIPAAAKPLPGIHSSSRV